MSYKFTQDWFTHNVPQWSEFLMPYAGLPCRMLEIGSFEGRSAVWIADNVLSNPDSSLTCVDPWTHESTYGLGGEELFDLNVSECERGRQVRKIKGRSEDVLPMLTAKFDFCYIDGNHEARALLADWMLVERLMVPRGLVCIDDYLWRDPTRQVHVLPAFAIEAILQLWRDRVDVIHKGYQVWLSIKD